MTRDPGHLEPWRGKDAPLIRAARQAALFGLSGDARFRLYFKMLNTPGLSELYVRGRGRLRHRRIQAATRIVIEAYPSSGSTYCRQSILLANPALAPNQVCSHTHSPRIVARAVRAGLPCLVIARDPRDAVSSAVQRRPGIHLVSAFRYYERYYRHLVPLKPEIVVAPFESVVQDFSALMAKVNAKYETSFVTEAEAGLTQTTIFADIDRRTRLQHGGHIEERKVSRPTTARMRSHEVLAELSDHERRAMEAARLAYGHFID